MTDLAKAMLTSWQNFYVIVGSSAGALIGLQFVVIALIADREGFSDTAAINAFGTPTVVDFSSALAISAIMCAPWHSVTAVKIALVLFGLSGLGYASIVFGRARRQTTYMPTSVDWFWYTILPWVVYAGLMIAALCVRETTRLPLFVIAAAALGLLFLGIRNAWDTVIYVVIAAHEREVEKSKSRGDESVT